VKKIIGDAYEVAKKHVRNNREAIDKLVDVLLEKETLTGDEFRAILSEYTDQPLNTDGDVRIRINDLISV
jgi:cell division protease FtsH